MNGMGKPIRKNSCPKIEKTLKINEVRVAWDRYFVVRWGGGGGGGGGGGVRF